MAFRVEFLHRRAAPVSQVSGFLERRPNNHSRFECRDSSATSVSLAVDSDSFLSLMNFLYFHVVSGNTFFFSPFLFHLPRSQSFCSWWSENCACRPVDLKENCGMELCLNFFSFFKVVFFFEYQLTCLAGAEAWGRPELRHTHTDASGIVKVCPLPSRCAHVVT